MPSTEAKKGTLYVQDPWGLMKDYCEKLQMTQDLAWPVWLSVCLISCVPLGSSNYFFDASREGSKGVYYLDATQRFFQAIEVLPSFFMQQRRASFRYLLGL